jgi:hypothetical protein
MAPARSSSRRRGVGAQVFGIREIQEGPAQSLFGGVAKKVTQARVDGDQATLGIGDEHAVCGLLEEQDKEFRRQASGPVVGIHQKRSSGSFKSARSAITAPSDPGRPSQRADCRTPAAPPSRRATPLSAASAKG